MCTEGNRRVNRDYFDIEDNYESKKEEKTLFGYFCRFVTRAFSLYWFAATADELFECV